jgi:hypothetical protein
MKYNEQSLQAELGDDFQVLGSMIDYHQTPFETYQEFMYCWLKINSV